MRALPVLLLLGCRGTSNPAPPPAQTTQAPASVMGTIVGLNVTWGDALVRGDSATLGSIYAEDAALMTNEGDLSGRAAILPWLLQHRANLSDSVHATRTVIDQLDVGVDRAYEAGTLTYTLVPRKAPGPAREVKVRYMTFWRQNAEGHWLMTRSLRPLP